jgi:hypothetical protein
VRCFAVITRCLVSGLILGCASCAAVHPAPAPAANPRPTASAKAAASQQNPSYSFDDCNGSSPVGCDQALNDFSQTTARLRQQIAASGHSSDLVDLTKLLDKADEQIAEIRAAGCAGGPAGRSCSDLDIADLQFDWIELQAKVREINEGR